jgi:endonuclease/exonuclease/phosphatase (EEP) superfamily protein YafD
MDEPLSKLKIATFNANNSTFSDNPIAGPKRLIEWAKQSNADVICIQEYRNHVAEGFETDSLYSNIGYVYQELLEIDTAVYANFGLKIFSKIPLKLLTEKKLKSDIKSSNGFQIIEIEVGSKSLILSNCHLNCYKLTKEITFSNILSIAGTFVFENITKNKQGDDLLRAIEKHSKSPIILTGDFNSFNYSYVSRKILSKGFYDSFSEVGRGEGETLRHKLIIPLRIDYQFHNEYLNCVDCHVDTTLDFSDHMPLICNYAF